MLGLVSRELRVAIPAGAAAFDCLRACRTVAAPIPDAQITTLAGVDHNVAATKHLLLRERDNSGYAQGVVLPVAAGRSSTGSSRGQPGRWPISGLLRWKPEGLPLVCGGPFRRPVRPRRFRSGPL